MKLFTVVTVRGDDLVLGWTDEEFAVLPAIGQPPAAVPGLDPGLDRLANALVAQGYLSGWLYVVGRSPEGSLRLAPVRRTAVLAAAVIRVEPHRPTHEVVAPGDPPAGPR